MATYVIGDIHGCYDQLQNLLDVINFDSNNDILWFTGDLVNGGPKPAEVVRFIKSLGENQICVLGNHDLVLLAMAAGKVTPHNDRKIGFEPFFTADDNAELIHWLTKRPILHYDPQFNCVLVHAGILPSWSLQDVLAHKQEIEVLLHGSDNLSFYENMFGNEPAKWSNDLAGWDRIRFILNCFVRMRFCTQDGRLDLITKGEMNVAPSGYAPWFQIPRHDDLKIIFGHWAALMGTTNVPNAIAMDTGCVWGERLSARNLNTGAIFSVPNKAN